MKHSKLGMTALLASSLLATMLGGAPALHGQSWKSKHGCPGSLPGTEKWTLALESRSFDLKGLRAAIRNKNKAEAKRIVKELPGKARTDQAAIVTLLAAHGGQVDRHHWLANACTVSVKHEKLGRLASHPRVRGLYPVTYKSPLRCVSPTASLIDKSGNSLNHDFHSVHQMYHPLHSDERILGQDVGIAIIDTGCNANMGGSGRPHRTFYINGKVPLDPGFEGGGGIGDSRLMKITTSAGAFDVDTTQVWNQTGLIRPDARHGTGVAGIAAGGPSWNIPPLDKPGHAPRAQVYDYRIATIEAPVYPAPPPYYWYATPASMIEGMEAVLADVTADPSIQVANLSWEGTFDPSNPLEIALENLAFVGDILVCTAAGNAGPNTERSFANLNGLSVGSVDTDTHKVSTWPSSGLPVDGSALGPIFGATARGFPDIVANGRHINMPLVHRESSQYGTYLSSGTSMASPQVAGAGALFRSVVPSASCYLTKSAILATTLDISAAQAGWPFNTRNAHGMGYLHDKTLIELATGARQGLLTNVTISSQTKDTSFSVTAGKHNAVVIAWPWDPWGGRVDLDLEVWDQSSNPNLLAASSSTANTYEKVVFKVPTGVSTVVIRALAKELPNPSLTFGLAAVELPAAAGPIPQPRPKGDWMSYGVSCNSTATGYGIGPAVPPYDANQFGNRFIPANPSPGYGQVFGWASAPTGSDLSQFIIDPRDEIFEMPDDYTFTARGIAFRRWFPHGGPTPAQNVSFTLRMAQTGRSPVTLPHRMENNATTNQINPRTGVPVNWTTVLQNQQVTLRPAPSWIAEDPNTWPARFLFTTKFDYDVRSGAGPYILLEFQVTQNPSWARAWKVDWVEDTRNVNGLTGQQGPSHSISSLVLATLRHEGDGPIIGFLSGPISNASPTLQAYGRPIINRKYALHLTNALPATMAWIYVGSSATSWGSLTLPAQVPGWPDCWYFASLEETAASGLTDSLGSLLATVTIPNDPMLIGVPIYHQGLFFDPNYLPTPKTVTTNALRGIYGQ